MMNHAHSSTTLVVQLLASPGTTPDPRLRNVHARRVRNFHPAPVLGLNLFGLGQYLAIDLSEPHAPLGNGQIARLLEVVLDLGGHFLLGPGHLGDGVVEVLAGDLAGEHDEFLDAGGHEVALVEELALRHADALLLGGGSVAADHLDDFFAEPARAASGVGIRDHGHVFAGFLFGGGGGGGGFCGCGCGCVGVGVGSRGLDFILENVVGDGAVHVALEKGGSFFGIVERGGEGVLGGSRGGGGAFFAARLGAPAFEEVDGPFGAAL